jgi:K+-transporting ATPase KdpF subunit
VFFVFIRPAVPAGPDLMSGSDTFGLIVSIALFAYLLYALFRGERL